MTVSELRSAPSDGDTPGAALARGDWSAALGLLRGLEHRRALTPEELDQLGRAAYGAGEFEAAVVAWEDRYACCLGQGDDAGAAASAATVAMYLMMNTGLMAPVRAWLARADRLLDGTPESSATAVVAMSRTYERFVSGDLARSREHAREAVATGRRHGVPLAVTLGRIADAHILVLDGDVDRGLALLDEAALGVVSGELDPLGAGLAYCELISAMQELAQYERAEQWTAAMDAWHTGTAHGGINGRCRVHRAEILRLRGSCAAAEEEALVACRELRPWMRREFGRPLTELGVIRLRRGDLPGAEEACRHGWDPQPGLALLRLAQGDTATAAALVADAIAHPCPVPSTEWPPRGELRRAPLLAAQVEIAVSADDLPTARDAAARLASIAATYRSCALAAGAALASARVLLAAGDAAAAMTAAEEAVTGWLQVGAPYETARARLVLARSCRAVGGRDVRADQEERTARMALARIGTRLPAGPSTLPATTLPATTLPATPLPAPAGGDVAGMFRLAGDTRTVTFAGRTVLVRDLKGMRYLARMLAEPGREFHVLDLVAEGGRRPPSGGAGPVLDAQARAAYRRRLVEIEEDLEEAAGHGDGERLARARADREYLVRELAGAFGLGGRARSVGSSSERARGSVGRALRYAVTRIGEHHVPLADHLAVALRTGTYCCYAPDSRLPSRWEV